MKSCLALQLCDVNVRGSQFGGSTCSEPAASRSVVTHRVRGTVPRAAQIPQCRFRSRCSVRNFCPDLEPARASPLPPGNSIPDEQGFAKAAGKMTSSPASAWVLKHSDRRPSAQSSARRPACFFSSSPFVPSLVCLGPQAVCASGGVGRASDRRCLLACSSMMPHGCKQDLDQCRCFICCRIASN